MQATRLIALLLTATLFGSCSRSNEADLAGIRPGAAACDSSDIRFSSRIVPILEQHCNSCHSSAFPSGGVNTDRYEGVKAIALNGKLVGSVSHDGTASPMPLGRPKLSQCQISAIITWVREGSKND